VFYYTEDGQVAYFPSAWTDAGQADPFVVLSAGRAVSRFEDLLRLVKFYLEELVASNPDLKAAALVQRVRRRFGVLLHVRTVEKALRKKGRQTL
jgi:hypothetical protein